ncbi:MAG: hypothetical protein JWN95_1798 [Frankiales bacterium]|nr:hypothetical protein [Frankiales bacterium]
MPQLAGLGRSRPRGARQPLSIRRGQGKNGDSVSELSTWLELKAAFVRRNKLSDPLGVLEVIYSDFEYRQTVERSFATCRGVEETKPVKRLC